MKLLSTTIEEGSRMPVEQSYAGGNLSPHLAWSEAPAGTKSFAVTCFDPDAPTGSGWWHWCVVNIPLSVESLPKGITTEKLAELGALTLKNDYGEDAFGGAAPPTGDGMHRYIFTVWALPVKKLGVTAEMNCPSVGFMLNAMAIGKAKLTATYVNE